MQINYLNCLSKIDTTRFRILVLVYFCLCGNKNHLAGFDIFHLTCVEDFSETFEMRGVYGDVVRWGNPDFEGKMCMGVATLSNKSLKSAHLSQRPSKIRAALCDK